MTGVLDRVPMPVMVLVVVAAVIGLLAAAILFSPDRREREMAFAKQCLEAGFKEPQCRFLLKMANKQEDDATYNMIMTSAVTAATISATNK